MTSRSRVSRSPAVAALAVLHVAQPRRQRQVRQADRVSLLAWLLLASALLAWLLQDALAPVLLPLALGLAALACSVGLRLRTTFPSTRRA